jgi:hypothetical protein
VNEFGPFDGTPIIQIGNPCRPEAQILALRTMTNSIHILDIQRPAAKRVIESPIVAVWPLHQRTMFSMVTLDHDDPVFYDHDLNVVHKLEINAKKLATALDRIIVQISQTVLAVYSIRTFEKTQEWEIGDKINLIAAEKEYFVVTCENDPFVTLCMFDGPSRKVDVGGPTTFLFVWGDYFFRVGEETLIECRDFEGRKGLTKIGEPTWWPHSLQTKLATCSISEGFLVTALDLKCVIWR